MSEPKEHHDSNVDTVEDSRPGAEETGAAAEDRSGPEVGAAGDGRGAGRAPQAEAEPAAGASDQEVDILRNELRRVQQQLDQARREATEYRERSLRSRAELENYRRRAAGDVERAREAGLDSALLAVLSVFDDLGRALQAAETSEDPGAIVPGVRAVRESLQRHLENLDIRAIGRPGEPFDPNQHEALTAVPLAAGAEPGTIADVFQAGFKRGERLVRPARVVVYEEPE